VFVEVSDTLIDEFDLLDFLHMLTMRTAELSSASVVGLVLADKNGDLRFMAASREDARLLELFQLQNDEGPCLDAFRSGAPVVNTDLRDDTDRWPLFAPHATAAGFRSVHAFPLRLRTQVIGALNVFGADDGARLDADDVPLVQALADMASIGLLQERTIRQGQVLTEQLQGALNSRVIIEQAKGAVAQARGVNVDEAFALIRGYARSNNRRLGKVAQSIIANIDAIPELALPDRRPSDEASSRRRAGPTRTSPTSVDDATVHPISRQPLREGVLSLHPAGDVDMDSSGQLDTAIQDAISEANVTTVIVNLDGVTFLDSAGIRTLLNGYNGASDHGKQFRIVRPSDLVRRVLDITGVLAMLTDGTTQGLPSSTRAQDAEATG
jgi:anti-anti-sigma factor